MFDQSNEEIDNTMEEDLPLGVIHMIGGPNHPNLENRIRGKIRMIKQINEVLLVQSTAKKSRQTMFKPRSITFFKADLERAQHPMLTPWSFSSGSTITT